LFEYASVYETRILTQWTSCVFLRQKLKLDEDMRWQITGESIEELHRYGGGKALDEEAPMRPMAPSCGPHDKRETLKAKPEK